MSYGFFGCTSLTSDENKNLDLLRLGKLEKFDVPRKPGFFEVLGFTDEEIARFKQTIADNRSVNLPLAVCDIEKRIDEAKRSQYSHYASVAKQIDEAFRSVDRWYTPKQFEMARLLRQQ